MHPVIDRLANVKIKPPSTLECLRDTQGLERCDLLQNTLRQRYTRSSLVLGLERLNVSRERFSSAGLSGCYACISLRSSVGNAAAVWCNKHHGTGVDHPIAHDVLATLYKPRSCNGMRLSPCTLPKADRCMNSSTAMWFSPLPTAAAVTQTLWIGLPWRRACRRGPTKSASL